MSIPGSPQGFPTRFDQETGFYEGKWFAATAHRRPFRQNGKEIAKSQLAFAIRRNRHAPVVHKGTTLSEEVTSVTNNLKAAIKASKERRMARKNRRTMKTWRTVKMAWTDSQSGLLELSMEIGRTEGAVSELRGAQTLVTTLPFESVDCHLCKVSGVTTLLKQGEAIRIWSANGEYRVSGVAGSDKHWDVSAKVTVDAPKAAPKKAATPPKAAPKPAPKPAPKAPVTPVAPQQKEQDFSGIIKAAKAAGASVVKLSDGTTIVF